MVEEDVQGAESDGEPHDHQHGLLSGPLVLLLQEGYRGARERHARRDPGDEQEEEPEEAGDLTPELASRQSLEDDAHRDDAEVVGAALGDRGRTRHAEESYRGRNRDRPAEHDFGELVRGTGRQPGQGHVVLLREVGRVAVDRTHPQGEREEHLAGGRQPDLRVRQAGPLGIPGEVEPLRRRGHGGGQREDADHEDEREQEEDRHPDQGELLDAPGYAARQHGVEEDDRDEEERHRHPATVDRPIEDVLVGIQVLRHLAELAQTEVPTREAEEAEPQHPGDDVCVVDEDHERHDDPEHAQILRPLPLPVAQLVEHAGDRGVAVPAAEPADRPLDPHERDPEQQEGDEVRDHEGAAAVLRGLHREAKEVAESDGVPGHGQDQPDPGRPTFLRMCVSAQGTSRLPTWHDKASRYPPAEEGVKWEGAFEAWPRSSRSVPSARKPRPRSRLPPPTGRTPPARRTA